jgi:hypothetical protein
LKTIDGFDLPRQARDKREESSKTKRLLTQVVIVLDPELLCERAGLPPWMVRKTPFLEPFMHKNDLFTKTGSGQT